MKIIYNSQEISNSTDNYNSLLNLPMINSATLQGVKTLNDINAYSKQQVDELISNSRAIEIVTALPANLIENTLYYVGPDANDFYDVYLVDEVRNVINIGTSQFGEYFAGSGIEIDDDNYIHAKIDNKTIIVDSEGNLHASLSLDVVPDYQGTSGTTTGVKGLVPRPGIGAQKFALSSSGNWYSVLDLLYPIGATYMTYSNSYDPNKFFPGTTWSLLYQERALWTNASTGNTVLDAQAPNVTGALQAIGSGSGSWGWPGNYGCFNFTSNSTTKVVDFYTESGNRQLYFDASRGTVNSSGGYMAQSASPYGKSNTINPKWIKICV